MIARILGEGQWSVEDGQLEALNEHDSAVESAIESGDEDAFRTHLDALLTAVRRGERLPDDSLEDSDLILPPADATLEEVRELLSDEGLIPNA